MKLLVLAICKYELNYKLKDYHFNDFVLLDTKNSFTNYYIYNMNVIIVKLISYNIFIYICFSVLLLSNISYY